MRDAAAPLYTSRLFGAGAWLLASGAVLCVFMLVGTLGPFRFGLARGAPLRGIGLWETPGTDPEASRRRAGAWRRALPDDRELRVASSLAELRGAGVAVVAVSDARALADADLAALLDFARAGGGVLLAGSVAVVEPNGDWRGYAAMAQLLGVERIEVLPRAHSQALIAQARGALSAPLLPGESIALVPEEGVPALPLAAAELAWSGDPAGAADAPATARAAERRLRTGRGRLLWLAAGPESSAQGLDAHGAMGRLLRAAFAWAAGEPLIEVVPPGWTRSGRGDADREQWRALREVVAARVEQVGPDRLLVKLTSRAPRPQGAILRLHGIPAARAARLSATELLQELPASERDRDSGALEIAFPELPRAESQAFYVDLEARNGA